MLWLMYAEALLCNFYTLTLGAVIHDRVRLPDDVVSTIRTSCGLDVISDPVDGDRLIQCGVDGLRRSWRDIPTAAATRPFDARHPPRDDARQ